MSDRRFYCYLYKIEGQEEGDCFLAYEAKDAAKIFAEMRWDFEVGDNDMFVETCDIDHDIIEQWCVKIEVVSTFYVEKLCKPDISAKTYEPADSTLIQGDDDIMDKLRVVYRAGFASGDKI